MVDYYGEYRCIIPQMDPIGMLKFFQILLPLEVACEKMSIFFPAKTPQKIRRTHHGGDFSVYHVSDHTKAHLSSTKS